MAALFKPALRRALAVGGGALVFALLFSLPLLKHLHEAYSADDWDHWRDFEWVSWFIVTHYHQLPLWSPYQCGGIPWFANAQARFLTPVFLMHLLFGPTVGINLEVPFHLAVAWLGGYLLARVLGLGTIAAVTCATVFPSSSWFYLHFGAGALDFLAFAYAPWIITCWWLAAERRKLGWSAVTGALFALTFFQGGTYTVAETGLALAVLALFLSFRERSLWPVFSLVIAALFTVGFAAPKLIPTWYLGHQHSRATAPDDEYLSAAGYLTSFFSRKQDDYIFLQWSTVGFQPLFQCAAYLSPPFVLLAAAGLIRSFRRCLPWLVLVLVFLLLGMGNYFGPYSPWVLLHNFPLYGWLQVSPKFFVMLVLGFGVIAAIGTDWLVHWKPRWSKYAAAALIAIGILDTWLIGPPNLFRDVGNPPQLPWSPTFREYQDESDHSMLRVNLANMGVTNCYVYMADANTVSPSNRPGYRGEQYLLKPGSINLVSWSPTRLGYQVSVDSPNTMVINQNYDSQWKLIGGNGEVTSYNGFLAVNLPPGTQRIELDYSARQFFLGVAIALVTVLVAFMTRRFGPGRDQSA
jgi:hypothetical protein